MSSWYIIKFHLIFFNLLSIRSTLYFRSQIYFVILFHHNHNKYIMIKNYCHNIVNKLTEDIAFLKLLI